MRARVEELYVEFGPMVYRRCLAVLKDEDAAYDALQDLFLKIIDSADFADRVRSPASFLYRMATNLCLNLLRKDRGRARSTLVPVEELPDEREDPLAASMLLELLASGLGERTRAIAYFRYADGMSLDEIAEQVELSRSAVRKHLDKFKDHARRHKERII